MSNKIKLVKKKKEKKQSPVEELEELHEKTKSFVNELVEDVDRYISVIDRSLVIVKNSTDLLIEKGLSKEKTEKLESYTNKALNIRKQLIEIKEKTQTKFAEISEESDVFEILSLADEVVELSKDIENTPNISEMIN